MTRSADPGTEARARQSLGRSDAAILETAASALSRRGARGAVVDLGCGEGELYSYLGGIASSYVGVDVVRYAVFPADLPFVACDLNNVPVALPDGAADIVTALETIEHLENPRQFLREAARLARPGAWIVISTPNQRSLLSLGALVAKGHFAAFDAGNYPAHQTALLDIDLRRIATESGLEDVDIEFTRRGRMPLTSWHYPAAISRALPRACSDNVLLIGRRRA